MIFENHCQVIVEKCVLKKTLILQSVVIININTLAWAYRIKCEKDNIMVKLTRCKWHLVRHILRKEIDNIMKEATVWCMFWMPDEKRKGEDPKT